MGGGWERGRIIQGNAKSRFGRAKPTDLCGGAVLIAEVACECNLPAEVACPESSREMGPDIRSTPLY
jgi:hypothetical protein